MKGIAGCENHPRTNVLLKGIFDFWEVEYQIVMVESWLKPKT
jgi:hypothetical protein